MVAVYFDWISIESPGIPRIILQGLQMVQALRLVSQYDSAEDQKYHTITI